MLDRRAQLRVKIKNLADESKTIQQEERAARNPKRGVADPVLYKSLVDHRRIVVRRAAREALLAYAMIRGVPYARIEPKSAERPRWKHIRAIADRFGVVWQPTETTDEWNTRQRSQRDAFDLWIEAAKVASGQY